MRRAASLPLHINKNLPSLILKTYKIGSKDFVNVFLRHSFGTLQLGNMEITPAGLTTTQQFSDGRRAVYLRVE